MHELAMAEGVLDVVLNAADGRTVRTIRLRVGRLHAVVPECFRFSFELLSEETIASMAVLEIEESPFLLQCGQCGIRREGGNMIPCQQCGSADMSMVSGAEFTIEEVQLDSGLCVVPENGGRLEGCLTAHLIRAHGLEQRAASF